MIASDDLELEDWIYGVRSGPPVSPGGFLFAITDAAVHADAENYALLRPALLELAKKYPKYSYKARKHG